ncbi:MAG: tetratricopeptide repeat protein [Armatimonadetes bacterium]|nr:tetratricopeptide repeat protein [Armatimonadota bacterium]
MTERERRQKIVGHLKAGEAQAAADTLADSQEEYPGDGILHHAIGLALASDGTMDRAREQLEAAARMSPDDAAVHADLAQIRLALGQSEEAIESAENALELDPDLAVAHFTLGRAYLSSASAQQARNPLHNEPGFEFALIDGRTPAYLKAVRELETALENAPPFQDSVRTALAFAYLRAGHFHAAQEQLQHQLDELPAGEESDHVARRLQAVEYEIVRENYWSALSESAPRELPPPRSEAETALRRAHVCAIDGDDAELSQAMAQALEAGYVERPGTIIQFTDQEDSFQEITDAHALIRGGLECVSAGELRFLPFRELQSVTLGAAAPWRTAQVIFVSGETLEVAVPLLYRLSLRSPNDLIQSGKFTQFKYSPGETRYALAIGTRNLATEQRMLPFSEVRSVVFA